MWSMEKRRPSGTFRDRLQQELGLSSFPFPGRVKPWIYEKAGTCNPESGYLMGQGAVLPKWRHTQDDYVEQQRGKDGHEEKREDLKASLPPDCLVDAGKPELHPKQREQKPEFPQMALARHLDFLIFQQDDEADQ